MIVPATPSLGLLNLLGYFTARRKIHLQLQWYLCHELDLFCDFREGGYVCPWVEKMVMLVSPNVEFTNKTKILPNASVNQII